MTKSNVGSYTISTNPFFDPLPPSVQDILVYEQELADECPYITFEWATREIKNHLLNWVRVGLVAEKVRYYKLWQGKFSSWQEYCKQALGKAAWQINNTIKAAQATMYLARAGFEILPTCEAQATKLLKLVPLGDDLITAWHKVIDSVPKHLISANAIGKAFGEEPKKQRLNISSKLYKRLQRKAKRLGISVEELLKDFLDEDDQAESEDEDKSSTEEQSEDEPTKAVTKEKLECWQADLEQMCREYDLKNWLSLTWLKLLVPQRPSSNSVTNNSC